MAQRGGGFITAHPGIVMDQFCCGCYLVIGYACDLFDIIFMKMADIFGVFVKAIDILTDVRQVYPSVFDQNISNGMSQCTVRA